MSLLVKSSGKYWRMDYGFADERKTLSIGVYPAVSLAKARKRREDARELLADEVDPSQAKRAQKQAVIAESVSTYKAVAMEWHQLKSKGCAATTSKKRLTQMENHIFPEIAGLADTIEGLRVFVLIVCQLKVKGASNWIVCGSE